MALTGQKHIKVEEISFKDAKKYHKIFKFSSMIRGELIVEAIDVRKTNILDDAFSGTVKYKGKKYNLYLFWGDYVETDTTD